MFVADRLCGNPIEGGFMVDGGKCSAIDPDEDKGTGGYIGKLVGGAVFDWPGRYD